MVIKYVKHPWIKDNSIEEREYQTNIAKIASKHNTLCVLPTGLGKTPLAALVVADKLREDMYKKILFMAPTKPLVEQHKRSFEKFLKIGPSELVIVTGFIKPSERAKLYIRADIVFATPQTIRNDLKTGKLDLENFSLCIFDEAHRAVGDYAYVYIAKRYTQQCKNPLILGLTASPGGQRLKINTVKKNLFIHNIEIRTRADPDVRPYIQELEQKRIFVELAPELKEMKLLLERVKSERMKKLREWKIIGSSYLSKTRILKLQEELARKRTGYSFAALSILAEIIKIDHALLLLETQCLYSLDKYFKKMMKQAKEKKSRAAVRLVNDEKVLSVVRILEDLLRKGKEHPKMLRLKEIVKEEIEMNPKTSMIVFAQFRDTIGKILQMLKQIKGAKPVEFIGQARKEGKGLTQKRQVEILNEFKLGFYNILCSSSIGEEGLDIEETDTVIFYEPIPSAIRKIQRMGRTGRTRSGKVIIFITKKTRDEAYHWSSYHKERKMEKILHHMRAGQKDLREFE
jgi:Fanconi anemia group M protein